MRQMTAFALTAGTPATLLLLALNAAAFAAAAALTGSVNLSPAAALRFGALHPGAMGAGELWDGNWRLAASGFLHFTPLHLLSNMLCLAAWGTAVERRLGTAWFALLYAASMLGGGLVALDGPRVVTAGASGAIAGLLGALLYLSLRRKVDMPLGAIAVTLAMNAAITFGMPSISWRGHLGGLAAGLLVCLGLEAAAWVSGWALRCRFPEWLKLDLMLIPLLAAAAHPGSSLGVLAALLLLYAVLALKGADMLLRLRRGTAAAAAAAVLAQAALLAQAGAGFGGRGMAAAGAALLLLAALHLRPLLRGLQDRSFIPASLQAERQRTQGL